jgi:hypothetical protein
MKYNLHDYVRHRMDRRKDVILALEMLFNSLETNTWVNYNEMEYVL